MKHGFRLVMYNSLDRDQIERAIKIFDSMFIDTEGHYGNGGWRSYWRRWRLGYPSQNSEKQYDMVIRRAVNNRRIFAAQPRTLVDEFNTVNWNQCMCPTCLGSEQVKIPFVEEDYTTYYETGEIKG